MSYKTKSGGTLKDVSVKNSTMTGYFSHFGNIDSDGDMMMPGSFSKSIKERGIDGKNQIWFLFGHDWNKLLSKPTVLKEDSFGLYYEATVNPDLTYAKDVLILAEEGHLNEHSFGFNYIPDKITEKENYNEIHEVKLYEGSIVSLGANSETPFLGFKSCKTQISKAHYLVKEINKVQKMLKVGNLTDDSYLVLEMQLNQIKEMLNNLEPEPATLKKDNNREYLLKLIKNEKGI
jgi:HK97 family phage prohead protease